MKILFTCIVLSQCCLFVQEVNSKSYDEKQGFSGGKDYGDQESAHWEPNVESVYRMPTQYYQKHNVKVRLKSGNEAMVTREDAEKVVKEGGVILEVRD